MSSLSCRPIRLSLALRSQYQVQLCKENCTIMSCLVDNRVELIGFAVEAMNFTNVSNVSFLPSHCIHGLLSIQGDTDNMKEKRSAIPDKQLVRLIVEAADPSRRLQDQRTRMPFTDQEEVFMDLVGVLQSRRMDDQRATLANLPSSSSRSSLNKDGGVPEPPVTEEEFVELLFRCQVRRDLSHCYVTIKTDYTADLLFIGSFTLAKIDVVVTKVFMTLIVNM